MMTIQLSLDGVATEIAHGWCCGRRNQGGGQSGQYYAGSQYARAGYAAGHQAAGGGQGHGEWCAQNHPTI